MYSKTLVVSAHGSDALRGPRAEKKIASITNEGHGITSLCPSVTETRPGYQDSRQT